MGGSKRRAKPEQQILSGRSPDEEYQYGPVRLGRVGKTVYLSNDCTPEEQATLNERMANMRPEVVANIQRHVADVRTILKTLDPRQVMNWCYFQAVNARLGKVSESEYSLEESIRCVHIPEYIHSVIAATSLDPPFVPATDETWEALTAGIMGIYGSEGLNAFFMADSGTRSMQPRFDLDMESFRVQAAMHFVWVRGNRYSVHDIEFLRDFLSPHTDVLENEYGMSAERIVEELQRIQDSHLRGIVKMAEDMRSSQERFIAFVDRADFDPDMSPAELMARFMEQEGEAELRQKVMGQLIGTDLIDLAEIADLTDEFLEALSFSPGEDDHFFAPGEKAGWPLRVLPIDRRPFLKYEDKFYYFNTHILFDRLYRAIEQSVRERRPEYAIEWKERQSRVSEERPREILTASLPGATSYGSLQYQAPTGKDDNLNWCEVDGIILCHETVFIVEIKAGAFTWTSPDDDFEAHLKSMDALLAKPALQAHRLASCLKDANAVNLYDAQRNPVLTLESSKYPNVIPVCVTLDNLGAWAHQVKELQQVGVEVAPSICCSIDDLRIYRDAFSSPALFLAYLHLRHEAEQIEDVHVNDELEHLGLFLTYGDYINEICAKTEELGEPIRAWGGFKEQIDNYFHAMLEDGRDTELTWPYAPTIVVTAEAMLQSDDVGRTAAMLGLLRTPKRDRNRLVSRMEGALAMAKRGGQIACLTTRVDITGVPAVCVAGAVGGPPLQEEAERAALKVLVAKGHQEGWALAIGPGEVTPAVHCYRVSLGDLSQNEIAALEAAVSEQQATIREWRKIRKMRNKPCPCGSGRKFKKCCGKS